MIGWDLILFYFCFVLLVLFFISLSGHLNFFRITFWFICNVFKSIYFQNDISSHLRHYIAHVYHGWLVLTFSQFEKSIEPLPPFMSIYPSPSILQLSFIFFLHKQKTTWGTVIIFASTIKYNNKNAREEGKFIIFTPVWPLPRLSSLQVLQDSFFYHLLSV